MKSIFLGFFIIVFCSCSRNDCNQSYEVIELNEGWSFSELGENDFRSATVPGSVHMDLLANEIIDNPFFERNELNLQWIEKKNWIYKTKILIDDPHLFKKNLMLRFNGLDTYAKVYLNNSLILSANNMFRSWEIEIQDLIQLGENELKLVFTSPLNENEQLVNEYPYALPSGNEPSYIATKTGNFTRKAAYQFGWDWGPRFVTMGIWKPIELISWSDAKIEDAYTITKNINKGVASLETNITLEVKTPGNYRIRIDTFEILKHYDKGIHNLKHQFKIFNPKLWWANNMGEPYLYEETISLIRKEEKIHEKKNSFGVRTIEFINEPDSIGTSFYFKLNDSTIFIKGANYIPQDVFLSRVSIEKYQQLIIAAKEANFNMIRVWGGGIYERDIFYELCDKFGILVWQDFMFSGSLYPNEIEFKKNIKEEVRENIIRLRRHPCIAIWCGNNEIEVAWENWGWQKQFGYTNSDSITIWKNYFDIFRKLIPEQISELDPLRSYIPTSPLSNWGEKENFNHSSMHYWGVWHGKEPFENFENNIGRFMVEYGFQSFPKLSSLKMVMNDSSLYLESLAMKHRQKSYIGNQLIQSHINQYFPNPKNFNEFIILSQKTQAIGLEMAINSHMNKSPHCMGTLFWQFNDCWPGPSWSVIDYYGNKKDAYLSVKNAFKSID